MVADGKEERREKNGEKKEKSMGNGVAVTKERVRLQGLWGCHGGLRLELQREGKSWLRLVSRGRKRAAVESERKT